MTVAIERDREYIIRSLLHRDDAAWSKEQISYAVVAEDWAGDKSLEIVERLVRASVDVDCCNLEIVKYLVQEAGANANVGLRGAAGAGHFAIVKFLVQEAGVDANNGLRGAAGGGHFAIVKFLVHEADVDANNGVEAAGRRGHLAIVKYLVQEADQ